ncbi:ArsR/SmtB family transcription factor [Streptomyces sp. NRRL S-237]|uniref:ArsR/SmtB family transcription factor n=1 Tax=Streptomyces sp. NRRL S-237 TaxID=1463895 RepID=UPI003B6369AA
MSLGGAPEARPLGLLDEPLPTVELARRLGVTAGAVSQHLGVLYATGLVSRARHGRQVLYRRSPQGSADRRRAPGVNRGGRGACPTRGPAPVGAAGTRPRPRPVRPCRR